MRTFFFTWLAVAGCTASADEVRPPADQLFFPTGAAIAPDERFLFVANANSELRFDSGSVSAVDLAAIDAVIAEWIDPARRVVPAGCEPDADHVETLTCDEGLFIVGDASVRVGNFATEIAVQDRGEGRLRVIVPTRGDPSITWIDWDGSVLSCDDDPGFQLCDDAHRLTFAETDPDEPVGGEPYGVYADAAGEFAIVTHLTTGSVSLIDSPRDGAAVVSDIVDNVFIPDPNIGSGTTGVAGRTPREPDDIIYVGSRTEDRIQTFTVGRPVNGARPYLLAGDWFFLNSVGGGQGAGSSNDTRGLAFSGTGDRLYLANRRPPSLQVFDTSLGLDGYPKNEPVGATDICRQATTLSVADTGDGERVYVTCFQDGEIYVVDPSGVASTDDVVLVGRGPYSAAAAPMRKRLYVTNFLEDTIAVLDITPGAATRNRVVLRVGFPRAL